MTNGPRRITDLADLEGLAQPTMTLLVKRLAERQLVNRTRPAEDGRVVLVSLTRTGMRVLDDVRARAAAVLHEYLADVSDEQIAGLATGTQTLAHLIAILQERVSGEARRMPPC